MSESENNPFAAPKFGDHVDAQQDMRAGIGRLTYFLSSMGILVVVSILMDAIGMDHFPLAPDFELRWIGIGAIVLLFYTGVGWITVLRLNNMGYSGWWCLGYLVPLLNVVVQMGCLAAPKGFARHRTLDTAGKVIVGLHVAFIMFVISFFILTLAIAA